MTLRGCLMICLFITLGTWCLGCMNGIKAAPKKGSSTLGGVIFLYEGNEVAPETQVDCNSDGRLDYGDLHRIIAIQRGSLNVSECAAADLNHDRTIDALEFMKIRRSVKYVPGDCDGDGIVTVPEYRCAEFLWRVSSDPDNFRFCYNADFLSMEGNSNPDRTPPELEIIRDEALNSLPPGSTIDPADPNQLSVAECENLTASL